MITLAICWKAIGGVAICLVCILLGIFGVTGIVTLALSDNRVKKTIGFSLLGVLDILVLISLYFTFAKEMCG